MQHVVSSIVLLTLCESQVTDPLTAWTEQTTNPMPYPGSILFTGYQSSTDRIWLVGGDSEVIMSYKIGTSFWQFHGQFSSSLNLGTVNAQSYIQWDDDSILFANAGRIRKFSFITPGLTSTNIVLPYARDAPCLAAIYEDWVFAVGGEIRNAGETEGIAGDDSRYMQIYDNTNYNWFNGPSMQDRRIKHACVIHNNYLYAFGGTYVTASTSQYYARTSSERIYVGDMANINSYSWSDIDYIANSNVEFHRAVSHSLYNQIYLIGGRDTCCNNGAPSRNIQIYDVATDTMELNNGDKRLNTGRSSPSVIIVRDKIYVFGGRDSSNNEYSSWEVSNILTFSPTPSPTTTKQPTQYPASAPTKQPTQFPSINPTKTPTKFPSISPSKLPTKFPTKMPSKFPSLSPTKFPSTSPSKSPTKSPTLNPTNPSKTPTNYPTLYPTKNPTLYPTKNPSNIPTKSPEVGLVVNGRTTTTKIKIETLTTDTINNNNNTYYEDNLEIGLMNMTIYSIIIILCVILCLCCILIILFNIIYKMKQSKLKQNNCTKKNINGIQMTNMVEISNENIHNNNNGNNNTTMGLQRERVVSTSMGMNESPPIRTISTPLGEPFSDLLDETNPKLLAVMSLSNVTVVNGIDDNIDENDIDEMYDNVNITNDITNDITTDGMTEMDDDDNSSDEGIRSNNDDDDGNDDDDDDDDLYVPHLKMTRTPTQGQLTES